MNRTRVTPVTLSANPADAPVLSARQVKAMLKSCDLRTRLGRRDRALLTILIMGGLRISEALNLRSTDVEVLPDGAVLLTATTLKRKNHKRCIAIVPPFSLEASDTSPWASRRRWEREPG